jgi:hypothetical protein
MMRLFKPLAALAVLMLLAASPASAQTKEVELGTIDFEIGVQRKAIDVEEGTGPVRMVRFEALGSDVDIVDVRILYVEGGQEVVRVRQTVKDGESSTPVRLPAGGREIQRITVTYRPKGPVEIQIVGVRGLPPPKWTELGCKKVAFLVDRDVIRVGLAEGFYKAIKLRVIGNDVDILELGVVYGNGARDVFRVRSVIPAGGETRPIDLRGSVRGLDRIEMLYRSMPNFAGSARICVDGLLADR